MSGGPEPAATIKRQVDKMNYPTYESEGELTKEGVDVEYAGRAHLLR